MFRKLLAGSLSILISTAVLFAHGDATHIMGTVTAVQGDHVTVKLQDGKTQMVMFDKATKYLTAAEKPAKRADVKVGTRVVIDAKMDEKMKMFLASEVRIGVTEADSKSK
jgi:DNA/RNA endonuclease YhcR with UshA esterase domain